MMVGSLSLITSVRVYTLSLSTTSWRGINGGLYLRDSEPVKQMVYATQNVAVMYSLTHLVGLTQAHNVCFIDRNHNGKTEIFDIQDFKEEETRTHRMFGMYICGKLGATPVGMSFPYRVQ